MFGEVVLGLAIVAMVVVLTLIVHKYFKSGRFASQGNRRSGRNRGAASIVTNYRHTRMNNENEDEYMTDVTIGGVGDGSARNDVMKRQYNPDEDVFTIEERSSSSTAAERSMNSSWSQTCLFTYFSVRSDKIYTIKLNSIEMFLFIMKWRFSLMCMKYLGRGISAKNLYNM